MGPTRNVLRPSGSFRSALASRQPGLVGRRFFFVAGALLALESIPGCRPGPTGPAAGTVPQPVYIRHFNHGCAGPLPRDPGECGGACLRRITRTEEGLLLDIQFVANCCPDFREEAALVESVLTIRLTDLEYGCRCLCQYENEFLVRTAEPLGGCVRISFSSLAGTDPPWVCGFDTLVTVPERKVGIGLFSRQSP
jgi:hypothetical protein